MYVGGDLVGQTLATRLSYLGKVIKAEALVKGRGVDREDHGRLLALSKKSTMPTVRCQEPVIKRGSAIFAIVVAAQYEWRLSPRQTRTTSASLASVSLQAFDLCRASSQAHVGWITLGAGIISVALPVDT